MTRCALVVIDVQNAILDGPGGTRAAETAAALDLAVARIASLISRARAASVPVIYVQHDGPPGDSLEPEQPGWNIRSEIAPAPGEPVVRKRSCDAFFETALEAQLNDRNANTLIVAGCMTQYCIDTSVRSAVSHGYDVVLAADGHMTTGLGDLTFEQIVAHHNRVLDGFSAGRHEVTVRPASEITF